VVDVGVCHEDVGDAQHLGRRQRVDASEVEEQRALAIGEIHEQPRVARGAVHQPALERGRHGRIGARTLTVPTERHNQCR
jgi:hypothetical protein